MIVASSLCWKSRRLSSSAKLRNTRRLSFLATRERYCFPSIGRSRWLVMIEAMACGTPVIAFRGGAVEEVIDDAVTGFVVNSVEEAAEAVRSISLIDRNVCRATFERRFSARRMCHDYVCAYERTIERTRTGGNGFHQLTAGGVGIDTIAGRGSEQ